MKRSFIFLIIATLLMTTTTFGAETKAEIVINSGYVSIDNNKIGGDSIVYNSTTYLPVRKIADAMGLKTEYDKNTNTINLTSGGKTVNNTVSPSVSSKKITDNVKLNSVELYVNGAFVDSKNISYLGTTYLPLRTIAEKLGVEVEYDKQSGMVNLHTNNNAGLKPMLKQVDVTIPSEPKSVEDFEKVFLYMANNDLDKIDLNYNPNYNQSFIYSNKISSNMESALKNVYYKYVDLFSGVTNVEYKTNNTDEHFVITVELEGVTFDNLNFIETQKIFEIKAKELNEGLKAQGIINSNMTQKDVAKALYTQVTTMLEYDVNTASGSNINLESFTGYGAITNNIAVCQGYTSLYNYLLKLNGIDCIGQSGELNRVFVTHIWTVAILDGKKSYIDTTFGDPVPDVIGYSNYKYFDIDKDTLSQDRSGVN